MRRMIELGSWMLAKVGRGPYVEAVAGDLVEGIALGRGAGWYWRQVFLAIGAAWWGGACARRGRIGFAVMWGLLWPVWEMVGREVLFWWLRGTVELALRPRQVIMLGQGLLLDVTYVWLGLLVYLAVDRERWRSVPLRRFVRAWATCFGMFVVGKVVLSIGVLMLLMKMGVFGLAAAPYLGWNAFAGDPLVAILSLLVGIGVMVPVRRRGAGMVGAG